MTRFETLNGEKLGVTFFGGLALGKVKFLSKDELKTLWSLEEWTEVVSDNGWAGTVGDLKDMLHTLESCSDEDMESRGWGGRLESGLHLRESVCETGELVWTR